MDKNASASATALPMEGELTLKRIIRAPRELVWEAWTNPEHMARWFGPKVFTNSECHLDVRVGGKWRIVMRAPDGAEYPAEGVYREVTPPEKLAFTNLAVDKSGKVLLDGFTTVTLDEDGRDTRLTVHTRAKGMVPEAGQMLAGMEEGWNQTLDGLVETAHELAAREISSTRVFQAPRPLVFEMFTKPEHVAKWWGPKGFSLTTEKMDVRPGGMWRFTMHGPDGRDYLNENTYVEVKVPEKLAFRHGPEPQFFATILFRDLGARTHVSMRMRFEDAALRNRIEEQVGAVKGLEETLSRLEELLASR